MSAMTDDEALETARLRSLQDPVFHARVHAAAQVVVHAYVDKIPALRGFMPAILPVLREAAGVALVLAEERIPA